MKILSLLAACRSPEGVFHVRWICDRCPSHGPWVEVGRLVEEAESGERHRREEHKERIAA